jgi:hypothetical protein
MEGQVVEEDVELKNGGLPESLASASVRTEDWYARISILITVYGESSNMINGTSISSCVSPPC